MFRRIGVVAVGLALLFSIFVPITAKAAVLVANVQMVGQDGFVGTIFGWLDKSYAAGSAAITSRTLAFKGNQNWKGYDRYGNLVTGAAGQVLYYPLESAPVQILTSGGYNYQITVKDSTGSQASSFWQSFNLNSTLPNTYVSSASSTGADGASARVGFSITSGARSANSNESSLFVNPNAPFIVYDATTGNVSQETWSMQSNNGATWSGTTLNGSISSNSNGRWEMTRSSGVWYETPYSVTRMVQAGYYVQYVISKELWCSGTDYNKPPNWYNHPGGCQYSKNTQYYVYTYGYRYVPPVYQTYYYGGWHYGSFPYPDSRMILSISNANSYRMSLTDGKVTYAVNLVVDPIRPMIADFTMTNDMVATQQPLSGLGIHPTGNLTGATETWYVISQKGIQTYSTLSALNNASFTTTTDFTATVAHVVQIRNQTYVSYKDFSVKNMGIIKTSTGGVLRVVNIMLPTETQSFPTDQLPVYVKAGGEVIYVIATIGNVESVEVVYSDGSTQNLHPKSPSGSPTNVWQGYYYPSSSQTIPLDTPQGTVISVQNIKVMRSGSFIQASSPLLIVSGSVSPNQGKFIPPRLTN